MNNNIIQGVEIVEALKMTDKTFNFQLTNVYGICQKINQCDNDIHITSYKNGINYIDFYLT